MKIKKTEGIIIRYHVSNFWYHVFKDVAGSLKNFENI